MNLERNQIFDSRGIDASWKVVLPKSEFDEINLITDGDVLMRCKHGTNSKDARALTIRRFHLGKLLKSCTLYRSSYLKSEVIAVE